MKIIHYLLIFTILSNLFTLQLGMTTYSLSDVKTDEVESNKKVYLNEMLIADHSIIDLVRLDQIPEEAINNAKDTLHIAYGHTSHGSQIITGMNGLITFKEANGGTAGLYDWHDGAQAGALDIDDYFVSGDLGNPDRTTWTDRTQTYLDNPDNSDVNVVMWSWCGQVSSATEENINTYLSLMESLETEYPSVTFVYMTGHVDGTGEDGNLHLRNEQIRQYCQDNNKVLYDFADIECYNPDGDYFGDKAVTDNCDYDSTGDGTRDSNWALGWQALHEEGVEWYDCSPAHTQALNGNQKAYAAWWLFARLAGWQDSDDTSTQESTETTKSSSTVITTYDGDPGDDVDELDIPNFTFIYTVISLVVLGTLFRQKKLNM